MFDKLINKQVCCYSNGKLDYNALSLLCFMYPSFRVVKSEFDIYPDEPFIYIGDVKWAHKINKHPEPHIIVASTGEYDLTNRNTLIDLAYLKHQHSKEEQYIYEDKRTNKKIENLDEFLVSNKPEDYTKRVKGRPKYLDDIYEKWTNDQFMYNWKYLWVVGSVSDKEIEADKTFSNIIDNFTRMFELIRYYLKATEELDIKYLENALVSFINNSMDISDLNTKSMKVMKSRTAFKNSLGKNVPYAVNKLLNSNIDNPTLRTYNFLVDLASGGKL